MTVLKGITPTPAQVADAYKQAFSPAIDQAAGKDGRISRREAERMADLVRKSGKITHYETPAYVGHQKIFDLDRAADASEKPGAKG